MYSLLQLFLCNLTSFLNELAIFCTDLLIKTASIVGRCLYKSKAFESYSVLIMSSSCFRALTSVLTHHTSHAITYHHIWKHVWWLTPLSPALEKHCYMLIIRKQFLFPVLLRCLLLWQILWSKATWGGKVSLAYSSQWQSIIKEIQGWNSRQEHERTRKEIEERPEGSCLLDCCPLPG